MTPSAASQRPWGLAVTLIVTGLIGWLSSFALVLDKIAVLSDPDADLDCNLSILVQCGKNLASWQGSVFFGVSNPIWGLGAFAVPIVIGVAIFAGARFANWFWWGLAVGVTLGMAWVIWFQYQSIFQLGTLCPWCMTMWAAMIPLFWTVILWELKSGVIPLPSRARRAATEVYAWTWVIVVLSYLVVALVAQLRLDVLSYL
jgi:uncharacterized membrane protein